MTITGASKGNARGLDYGSDDAVEKEFLVAQMSSPSLKAMGLRCVWGISVKKHEI